ncbi:hypothetical protein JB92DRAFT_3084990 [Gautieria morchelliformis]|nr:hypothetical protein JB92DRAFT_3084990 [Gautieria morchelliformis]
MFLLDLLDNLPRLRLSERHMEMFLWVMSECSAQEVPSLYALRQTQERLRKECGGVPTSHWESSMGNILYLNDISKIIANDYANPQVASLLHFYPEETDGPVSESWQTKRIKEMPLDQLTPMYRKGLKDFNVNKLAELESGDAFHVAADGLVVDQGLVTIDAEDLLLNYLDLVDEGRTPALMLVVAGAQSYANAMPNPLRAIADGDELYTSFVFLWADDVGGNITMLINAHKNIYLAHANVPGRLLQQEYFVRFVATTPHGTTAEQFEAVLAMVRKTLSDPPRTYNAHSHQFCKFRLAVPGLPADNPQQSEEASHIGPSGNCKCRRCTVGGPAATRESDDGYHALHEPGPSRTVHGTIREIEQQFWTAAEGKLAPVSAMQTATGVKDRVAQIWIGQVISQAKKLKKENPSWTLTQVQGTVKAWLDAQPGNPWSTLLSFPGLDPHKDTPVEILHTILLRLIKYVWHNLHTSWTDSQHELFIARLQGTNIDGLSVPPIRAEYMSQYRNSLIGKHFKTLMQTSAFHVHGLLTDAQFELVKAAGRLGAVLWYHVIPDMAEYLADLHVLIGNVLDAFDGVDPARITNKAKLHILVHLPEDVEWFGPPIRYATEVFECFNHIFRMCSVLSNHHAPGRDIARKCSSLEHMKHIMSGGFWPSNANEWTQASRHVRSVLHSHPIVQTHLGWVAPSKTFPGQLSKHYPAPPSDSTWIPGLTVVAESEDTCHLGSWSLKFGRIQAILVPEAPGLHPCIIIDHFSLEETLHPDFDMPCLSRPPGSPDYIRVRALDIKFIVNVQHDCRRHKCTITGTQFEQQERVTTKRTTSVLEHQDDTHFILNLFALHNAHLVRQVLPRHLTAPQPLHVRRMYHDKVAAALRVSQALKRSRTKAKAKATHAANKQKRNIASQENDGNRLNILGDDVPGEGPEDLDSDDDHVCQDPDEDIDGGGDPDADFPIIRSTRARPVKRRRI